MLPLGGGMGVRQNLLRLCPCVGQLPLHGGVRRLLGGGELCRSVGVGIFQLLTDLCHRFLRVRQRLCRFRVLLLIVLLPLLHKRLDGLVEQQIQPACQNHKIQQVQQNLLPINIQRDIHGFPPALLIGRR